MSNPIRYMQALTVTTLLEGAGYVDLPQSEFDWVTSKTLWGVRDRGRAQRCLESLTQGAVDYVGLPRIELPAEYIAAVIYKFIDPINWMLACCYMEGCTTASQTIAGQTTGVTSNVLFSHLLLLADGDTSSIAAREKHHTTILGDQVNG